MGAGANTAGYANATAIGAGATNTAANQMMFGGVTTTYAAPGITSAASRAAQNGATNFVTSDGNGNLATSDYGPSAIAGLSGAVNSLGMNVVGIWQSVGNLQRSARRGYEGSAVAIANTAPTISRDARFGVSAKWGNFRGENAFGAMAQVRLNPNIVINGSLAVGLRYGGVGGGVGGLYEW
ncbi:MAG: Cell surface protein [Methylocystaceae bacterium]|nr:MAG: Cell surface [Methylocystaceae bacterium]TXT43326.1 MAG: Cell surface protein [Methylocystaceae bacterium]